MIPPRIEDIEIEYLIPTNYQNVELSDKADIGYVYINASKITFNN